MMPIRSYISRKRPKNRNTKGYWMGRIVFVRNLSEDFGKIEQGIVTAAFKSESDGKLILDVKFSDSTGTQIAADSENISYKE